MVKVNPNKKNRTLLITLFVFLFLCNIPAFAHHHDPIIFNYSPQTIQYGVTNVVVTGVNLNSTAIGVSGENVLAVVTGEDPEGKSLSIQFAVRYTAEPGVREVFLRNDDDEVRFPITVVPFGAPTIDSVSQNTISPGSSFIIYISGMGLNDATVATAGEQFKIISSQSSTDGSLLVISGLASEGSTPGSLQTIYITTPGGQAAPVDLTVSTTTNLVGFDPYSARISTVETDPLNKNQLILNGSMFDPDPLKNIVTLLEDTNGNTIGRQVEVISANNNQIVINLPTDVTSSAISLAVSSSEGKSSNIKTIDLNSLLSTDTNISSSEENKQSSPSPETNHETITTTIATNIVTGNPLTNLNTSQVHQAPNNTTSSNENNLSNIHKEESTQHEPHKQNDKPLEKATNETTNSESLEDTNIARNITTLSQYLFTTTTEVKGEVTPSINEIKDPAKLISTIEEGKQIKNQADLIMIAINETKQNQEVTETLKKAEALKNKVEELEKLLNTEKQKNKPDQKKLAKYQQLLESANAESRSQTFAFLNNILKYKPQLKNLLTQKPFDLAAIQPNIPSDSVILQYVPTEEGLIIFVVDNKNLKTRINRTISKDILNREVQAYRQLFENEIEKIKLTGRVTPITSWKNDKSSSFKKEILPLKEKSIFLYNALISPIEKDILNKKVVAIIANGWLRYLPFQSLAKPQEDGDVRFLISDKSVVYLDSVIAVSKSTLSPLTKMSTVTIFANPDGSLLGATKEAEVISMLFTKTVSLIQKPFNKYLINQLAKKTDILHLATHGYLDGIDIDSSYLVTGKTQIGDKLVIEKLFLKDIYDLNLNNSKLVVLSGCDTGKLGSLSNEPDDIVGSLATAFRVAGANTILASLWKAHDEATKIIMQSFYENLRSGLDKAESLRRAELKVKENPKYGHPLFWSLFNLIGDWR